MVRTPSGLDKLDLDKLFESINSGYLDCGQKGHPNAKTIGYASSGGPSSVAEMECPDCGLVYRRPTTDAENERVQKILRTPLRLSYIAG